jgi:hypothetical protein
LGVFSPVRAGSTLAGLRNSHKSSDAAIRPNASGGDKPCT